MHTRDFRVDAWTTRSGCIAPRTAMATGVPRASKEGRADESQQPYQRFPPLKTLRDRISPIRVLFATQ